MPHITDNQCCCRLWVPWTGAIWTCACISTKPVHTVARCGHSSTTMAFSYEVVEVNPVTRAQIKFSKNLLQGAPSSSFKGRRTRLDTQSDSTKSGYRPHWIFKVLERKIAKSIRCILATERLCLCGLPIGDICGRPEPIPTRITPLLPAS